MLYQSIHFKIPASRTPSGPRPVVLALVAVGVFVVTFATISGYQAAELFQMLRLELVAASDSSASH